MDAHAHLISLGWAGPGHALDARPYQQKGHRGLAYDPKDVRSTGNGLVKPLLVSQRHGRLGVGKKAHIPQAGNEWWLKGFESALGNVGKSESERSSGTATPDLSTFSGKHNGLYSFFVKGQQMEGTIKDSTFISANPRKRKSDVLDENDSSSVATPTTRDSSVTDFEQVGAFIAARDKKETKRLERKKKAGALKEFAQAEVFFQARDDVEMTKPKHQHEAARNDDIADSVKTGSEPRKETKEERKERRRKRRAEKDAKQRNDG